MIDKTVTSLDEALAGIADGATVMISGFQGAGSPSRLLQSLIEMGPKDLTVIANGAGQTGSALAKLMGSGMVRKLICSSARGRGRTPSPFEEGWKAGRIELEIVPQGTFAERIRAGGAGIGGFYSPVGVDTKIADGKETRHIDGRDFILELPLKADVALIKGDTADRWGNVSYRLAQRNFGSVMASAADLTVFEVREIVPLGVIEPEAIQTPGIFVNRVLATGDML